MKKNLILRIDCWGYEYTVKVIRFLVPKTGWNEEYRGIEGYYKAPNYTDFNGPGMFPWKNITNIQIVEC